MAINFRGEFRHSLDSKKRVAVPADFRRAINAGRLATPGRGADALEDPARLTIVYGDDRLECLQCYSESTIQKIDDAIAHLGRATHERKFLEFFFQTRSVMVQLDPTGRLVLAEHLRTKIDLQTSVIFAGKGESFEIWNPQRFQAHQETLTSMFREGPEAIDPIALIDACHNVHG